MHAKIPLFCLITILFSGLVISACNGGNGAGSNDELTELLLVGDIVNCGTGEFGEVSFVSSCSEEVSDTFELAMALLHSFEYDEAEKAFAKVIRKDPDCAMAYWGVAMSNLHMLWRPPTEASLIKGERAIEAARKNMGDYRKERLYIEAMAAFYKDWRTTDHQTRIKRYEDAMAAIYERFPEDKEAAVFYALSLNATAAPEDKNYRNQRKAVAILESLFPDQPNHPGIAHYLIHNCDNPVMAENALDAARRYAQIAPSSAHAQHMPSHIFTRLGLWQESIASNLQATAAARCYAEQSGMSGDWDEGIHCTDYLVYAYLQTGQSGRAKALVDYMSDTLEKIVPVGVKGAYPTAAIPARYALELRLWDRAAALEMASSDYPEDQFPWSNGVIRFARVLGAVHTNDLDAANDDLDRLRQCHASLVQRDDPYLANQVLIMLKAAEAWIAHARGESSLALELMTESAALENATEKQPLTPGEVLPAQELLGDLLLATGHPVEALEAYQLDLQLRPGRFNALYGAFSSAVVAGQSADAQAYARALVQLTQNAPTDRPEMVEVRAYIGQSGD
ncbi:MAG: hypothetical protein R3301_16640 [Saprospiraceae bacterium]|nr:hypothetical protein [Saprospiraceae bacterium]